MDRKALPVHDVELRRAHPGDTDTIVDLLHRMLKEMAALGGHPVAEGSRAAAWLGQRCAATVEDPEHLFLLAEAQVLEVEPVGLVEASITRPPPVFRTRRVLHIHAVYVLPGYRRRGIALRLLEAALEWGRAHSCAEAELNTLCRNPARYLYESLGFTAAEVEMRRIL
jgi:GNAT superfamily N-acetyltransferase